MTGPRRPSASPAAAPGRMLSLTLTLCLVALTAAVAGLAVPAILPPDDALGGPARFAVAVAVMALSQLGRLRFRVAGGAVSVTWGEAALIVGLYLVPAGWLPAAALLGAGAAWVLLSVFADRRPPLDIAHNVACLTSAVALATTVSGALGVPLSAPITPALAGVMAAGAVTYLLVTAWLAGLTMSLRRGTAMTTLVLRAVRGKLLMFVGNVVLGLTVIVMIDRDPRWLLMLPPIVWLLQQTYSHRLRADDERRAWQVFAQATRALNQLDERSVARAGVRGALALFEAQLVDIDVPRPGGRHRYRGDAAGRLVERDVHPPEPPEPDGHLLTRPLLVGDTLVGELRVWLPRSGQPGRRDHDALSAFGDALGAALHDAATHRELREVAERSSYEAVHDPLTHLANRSAVLGRGEVLLRQLPHDRPVALLLLDINHFKEVNDTLGHGAGDELLKVAATRLTSVLRPDELLGRLGGDEFALLTTVLPVLTGATALADRPPPVPQAVRRAREIAELLATPAEVAGVRMSVEVSIGVVVAPAGAVTMTELLRRADIAMYQAKTGGNSIASYDGTRDAASTDQLALLAELREALCADDQLVLALQPAVDLSTGGPTGVEALIRWRHPRRGWLNPGDFVRTIENSDLLGQFTRYVVDRALTAAADWRRHGIDVPVSINISARSLLDPRLPADIADSLRRHHLPPSRLVLEITETVMMSELEVIDEVLEALRGMGVQLAVDDFGTGFSSLTFLTRIPVDELKVDRSFVTQMAESPKAAAIVRTTVDLGRELGLRVVAEGVETADQRAALAALGCTAAQGYHFFRPMPSDKIVGVLRSLRDSAPARVLPLRADGA